MEKEAGQVNHVVKEVAEYRFSTADLLGSGYSSNVYKGIHIVTGDKVAIKVVQLNKLKSPLEERLLGNQVRAVKSVKHPNVIRMFQVYQTTNNVYFVSEFCEGDLTSVIKGLGGPMPEDMLLKYAGMMFQGIQALHRKAIIHRDIKPANFLVREGVLKVADLGFCEFLCQKGSESNYGVGSPLYMSPQSYRKNLYSFKSDIWACGISIYEMILGCQPFKGLSYDAIIKRISEPTFFQKVDTSDFLRILLQGMLALDLGNRLSLLQCRTLLLKHLNGQTTVPRPVSQRCNLRAESPILMQKRPSSSHRADSSCGSSRTIKVVVSRLMSVQKSTPVFQAPTLARNYTTSLQNIVPQFPVHKQEQAYQRKAIFQNLFPRGQQYSRPQSSLKQEVKLEPRPEEKFQSNHRLVYRVTEDLVAILEQLCKSESPAGRKLGACIDQQCKLFVNKLIHYCKLNQLTRAELKPVLNKYHAVSMQIEPSLRKLNVPKSFYHKQVIMGYKKSIEECMLDIESPEGSLYRLLSRHLAMVEMFGNRSTPAQIQQFMEEKEN